MNFKDILNRIFSFLDDALKEHFRKSRIRDDQRRLEQDRSEQIRKDAYASEMGRLNARDRMDGLRADREQLRRDPLGIDARKSHREALFGFDILNPPKNKYRKR